MSDPDLNKLEKGEPWPYYGRILETASQRDGISSENEDAARKWGVLFITHLHERFNTSYKVWASAITYFHRFFYLNSYKKHNIAAAAAACFYIAGLNDMPSPGPHEICRATQEYVGEQSFSQRFGSYPERTFIGYQVFVSEALGWTLLVGHSYEFIASYLNAISGNAEDKKKIRKDANMFFSESMRTLVCLSWRPQVLAVVMIHMAAKRNGLKVTENGIVKANDSSAPFIWWRQFVDDVSPELVEEIAQILYDSYEWNEPHLPEVPKDGRHEAATTTRPCGGGLALCEEAADAAANTTERERNYSSTSGATFRIPAFDVSVPPPAVPWSNLTGRYCTGAASTSAAGRSFTSVPPSASGTNYCASFPPPSFAGHFSTTVPLPGREAHYFHFPPPPIAGHYTTTAPPPSGVRNYPTSTPPPPIAGRSSTTVPLPGSEASYYHNAPPPPAVWRPTSACAPTSGGSSYATATIPPSSAPIHFRPPHVLPPDAPVQRCTTPFGGLPDLSAPPPSLVWSSQQTSAQLPTTHQPQLPPPTLPPPPTPRWPAGTTPLSPQARRSNV